MTEENKPVWIEGDHDLINAINDELALVPQFTKGNIFDSLQSNKCMYPVHVIKDGVETVHNCDYVFVANPLVSMRYRDVVHTVGVGLEFWEGIDVIARVDNVFKVKRESLNVPWDFNEVLAGKTFDDAL